jgi:hypothetical protein
MPDTTLPKLRDRLAQAIFDNHDSNHLPAPPLECSAWVAMSALQKAIRRGEVEIALRAAATLHRDAPERLFRRLAVIAFEDVGIADIEAVSLTVAALIGKRWRAEVGGEWAVASYLIKRLANAAHDRACDDLCMMASDHPRYAKQRLDLGAGSAADSLALLHSAQTIEERALAIWSLNAYLREGRGKRSSRDPFMVFAYFADKGVPAHILAMCDEGFRKTRETLALLFPLIYQAKPACGATIDDVMPPQGFVNGVPLWALDKFTREGREAYRRFLLTECSTAKWMKAHVPRSAQIETLGTTVFAIESGQLSKRLRWQLGDQLREKWHRECHGRYLPDATEFLVMLINDLPLLNEVRASCF